MSLDRRSAVLAAGLSVVRGRRAILSEIDLAISEGQTLALMGPNGSGKSTFLKCLAGILGPTQGTLWVLGVEARSLAAKRQVGFVGHEPGLYAEMTAEENVVFAARMHGLDCPRHKARLVLAQAEADSIADQPVGRLSQGVLRRLAIIRGMIHDPRLILLDEPFTSLDQAGRQWLAQRIRQWQDQGKTVCFASHDLEQSRAISDRIVWLERGRVAASEGPGTPKISRRSA
jgi:heme exporter protein A